MAKIDRYDGNLRAFGSSATGTERTVFGDTSQSDTLDDNVVADFFRGWGITGPTFNPTKQDFNGLGFTLGQLIAYLHQQGIPEWNTSQEYYRGSVVTTLAGIYRLKNGGDATVDPDNDNGTNWELAPTRAEVDAKANQATTYTETEVDNLLDDKADQANTYTETEVDELTGSLAYPNTTLASSSDISENLIEPITAYPHIQGFRTGTGTALTFAQVVEEAAERGARLLTIQELEAGVADGTGFAYNEEITWTSSPAGVGLVYGNLGSGAGTRVVLNTNTDTAAGGYAVSVIGQRQWTDTQYAAIAGQTFTGDIAAPKITASTGILFGTDTAAANTLYDYEEGTWTPALVFGGGSSGVTYSVQIGNYTKVGNLVYAHAFFSLTAKGTSTGNADITNLPFPSNGVSDTYNVVSVWSEDVSFSDVPQSYTIPGTTKITLQESTTAGVRTRLNQSNYSDTSIMMVSVTYRTP